MNNSEAEIMGENFARYYDKIYHWKDYEKESERILEILAERKIENYCACAGMVGGIA